MHDLVAPDIEAYAKDRTTKPGALLLELEAETWRTMEQPQMVTGSIEGRFLALLIRILGAKRVLELGTFTGYATLSMAEALPDDGRIWTCELNPAAIRFARRYFERSPAGQRITLLEGPALTSMDRVPVPIDLVFIDADKTSYGSYYEKGLALLRPGGVIAVDNALWSGAVLSPQDVESRAIDELNRRIADDDRVESVLLTVRDGIHLVRKR